MHRAVARSIFFIFFWTAVALILFAGIRYRHIGHAHGYPHKARCLNQHLTDGLGSCQFRCPGGSCEAKEICDKHGCVSKFECDCNKKPAVPIYSKWCSHNKVFSVGGICSDECAYGTCVTNRYFFCSAPSCWNKYRCDCDKKPRIIGCFHGQEYSRFDKCDIHCDGGSCEANYDECSELGCMLQFKCNCNPKSKYEGI